MSNLTSATKKSVTSLGWILPGAAFVILAAGTVAAMAITGDGGERREARVPEGSVILASLDHTVSTERNRTGDQVRLEVTEPVLVGGDTVIASGAVVRGEVTYAKGGGRIAGAPALTLRFTDLETDAGEFRVDTRPFRIVGKSDAAESAGEIGGGAVAGGILGGILGGGGGAAKGAIAGAAIGTGIAIATDGDDLVIPAGTTLKIELRAPLVVRYDAGGGE